MRALGPPLLLLLLLGCGPSGQLASYNPSEQLITVKIGDLEQSIAAGETRTLRWRGSPLSIQVLSESGELLETVEATPQKGDRWLLHHLGGDRCFGSADFSPLYQANSDGALSEVSPLGPGSWLVLEHEMAVWPGQRLPVYTEDSSLWGVVEIPCGMTGDKANTHAAIQFVLDDILPK